ncbi:oligosaccharide flippase family protein, partial [Candidatus Parcubacteria bacterium]|nr:oligosaccharide flippase family protein [Candidatus Parcubacteria bacterium]
MFRSLQQKIYKLLKRSEKYTKTDMVYLAKGGFWLTLYQGFSILTGFLLAIAFANLLPKETYGTYKYILSIASLLSIPTLSGINTAITQAVARGFEQSFYPALKTKIKWGLLGGVASLFLALYYYTNDNNTLTISFLIVALFTPFMDPLSLYTSYLSGKKEFRILSKYNIITRVFDAIVLGVVIYFTSNLFLLVAAYFIANTTIRFIFFKLTTKNFPIHHKYDPSTLSYGKHLSLMNIITTIAGQLDKVLVFHYLGAVDLAIFSFAIIMPEHIKGIFKNINALAFPKFSENHTTAEIKKTIFKKMGKLLILATAITIVYVVASPYIFRWLFPEYIESIFYSQIFAISIILLPITGLMLTALQAQKAQKELYQFNIYSSITQIVILFFFIYF